MILPTLTTTTLSFANNSTAEALYQEGKYQEALVEYHKLVQTNPIATNYMGLALTYQKLNHTIHAIEALNEGIARNPQNITLPLFLAQIHIIAQNFQAAKPIVESLYAQYPKDINVAAMYQNYLIGIQDYRKAKELIPLLETNNPVGTLNNAGILNNIGLVYIETGDMRSAIETFHKGFKIFLANPLPKAKPKQQLFMDPKAGKRGLLAIKQALDDLGVPFLLVAGTLLGIYRDGDLLPHDKDIDLGLPWNIPRAELVHAVQKYGFVCNYSQEDITGEKGKWNISLVHVASGSTIDFFFIKPEGDVLVGGIHKNGKTLYTRRTNRGRSQIEYAGQLWWTFGELDLFLEELYGKDWRIPQANYNTLILSETVYDPDGVGLSLCYNHCLGALCEAYYKKAHGYCLQLLSIHNDPLLEQVKNYLEQNLSEEWYPQIPYRKKRTNNKDLFGIED